MSENRKRSALDWIEWAGNKLPEPSLIFVILTLIVALVAATGDALDWQVTPVQPRVVTEAVVDATGTPVLDAAGQPQRAPARGPDGQVLTELVHGDGRQHAWEALSKVRLHSAEPDRGFGLQQLQRGCGLGQGGQQCLRLLPALFMHKGFGQ